MSQVIVLFKLDVDIQKAATEVRERVAQTRFKLPTETKEPIISRLDVGAAPVITYTLEGGGRSLAESALGIVHDMNPYLTFVALAEPGKQLAARLVVLSTYTDAPRLAWEARYSFSCWNTGHGDVVPKLARDSAYVYVDARNGSLVFGRDTARKGGGP